MGDLPTYRRKKIKSTQKIQLRRQDFTIEDCNKDCAINNV